MELSDALAASRQRASAAVSSGIYAEQFGSGEGIFSGMVGTSAAHGGCAGGADCVWAFAAGDERGGIAGAGESGDRIAEAEESAAGGIRDLFVFDAVDEPDQLFGGADYSGRQARDDRGGEQRHGHHRQRG